jgi:hypothetical protein
MLSNSGADHTHTAVDTDRLRVRDSRILAFVTPQFRLFLQVGLPDVDGIEESPYRLEDSGKSQRDVSQQRRHESNIFGRRERRECGTNALISLQYDT